MTLVVSVLMVGCKSVEGTYYPGCVAYEGDKVQLEAGRVVWDRYTDQVFLDADGNMVEPFPEYPLRGTYDVDGDAVVMTFDGGASVRKMHVVMHAGQARLLTEAQFRNFASIGKLDDCALTLDVSDAE